MAEVLCDEEAACPELAAAVLVERGRSGMRVDEWAKVIGVDAEVVTAAEAGTLPFDAWPARLRLAVPVEEDEERWMVACAPPSHAELAETLEPGDE